ncbi:MAG: putative alpha/beta-hydrolase family hydrolase [Myxococcota bacterium]|jgi:predicted alpha/beta-hydrolase family hydrolase
MRRAVPLRSSSVPTLARRSWAWVALALLAGGCADADPGGDRPHAVTPDPSTPSSTGTTPPTTPSTTETAPPAVEATEWEVRLDPDDMEPDLSAGSARLFLPTSTMPPRAVVVFLDYARGSDQYKSDDWRRFAAEEGIALAAVELFVAADGFPAFKQPVQAAHLLERMLDALAEETGEPDVGCAPLVLWGHSAGAFTTSVVGAELRDRLAGHIGWHGSVHNSVYTPDNPINAQVFHEDYLAVPALFVIGEHDLEHIRESTVAYHQVGRALGARWSFALQAGAAHWDLPGSTDLTLPWTSAMLAARLPTRTCDPLRPIPEADGVGGLLLHYRIGDDDGLGQEVVSAAELLPTPFAIGEPGGTESWLVDRAYAEAWLAAHLAMVPPG